MGVYRGILIKESFHGAQFPSGIAQCVKETYPYRLDGVTPVTIAKLEIPSELVHQIAWEVAKKLLPTAFYSHFVFQHILIVAFPNTVVRVHRDNLETAKNARKVGRIFNIPDHQMKFELLFDEDHPKLADVPKICGNPRPAAVITGGTRGIGFAVACGMAMKGYNLFLGYHSNDAIAVSAKNTIAELCPECVVEIFPYDNFILEDCQRFFRAATEFFPSPIAFIHAAGISKKDWDDLSQCGESLVPVLACPELFVRQFCQCGLGHVVLVSSTAAQRPFPKGRFYAAAKAALEGYIRSVAVQSLPHLFINSVAPGIVFDTEKHGKDGVRPIYKGKLVTQATDVASLIIWLASENKGMTGQSLTFDNGLSVGLQN